MNKRTSKLKKKATILIVEDSRTQAEELRYILEQHSYNTEVAKSGKEALAILSERKMDIVITDIVMPEMQGYELCQRIKSDKSKRNIPVILLTALNSTENVLQGLACGADSFITKPYSADYLISGIERILSKKTLNKNLRQKISVEIMLDGKIRSIETEYHQTLNLLISSYEAAVIKNTELIKTQDSLKLMNDRLEAAKISQDAIREYSDSIINTVREPLLSLDQDLRVVSASRSFYEVFKVKPKETVGQLIYDLGNKQWDIPKLRELLETILPQKATFDNYEVEHDFADIGRRIMLLNARQIQRVSGKERIILLAIEDITARKEIENGLKKAHKELQELAAELKRTTRAKSEFLANMSHELRTPLNSINGFSEVLYDETFGPLNGKQKKYVNYVLTSGKHLLLLINQILDMAKVEAGKMSLASTSLPLKSLLNDISMLVADMVSKKKLHMQLEIAEDLPNIEADELKVKEILYNLLSNAVKFTPEGGKIGMRAKRINSEIEVDVWDTGDGIALENMEKIFEGFFRVDTPYSRVTEGSGLGLPLSKKLVELHGGKLSVVSEGLNKGTMVRFTLPITAKEGSAI